MSETTELQRALETLTKSIESLRDELVRKDVYASDQRALKVEMTGIREDVKGIRNDMSKADEQRSQDRRLILGSFIMPLLLSLLLIYVAAQTGST